MNLTIEQQAAEIFVAALERDQNRRNGFVIEACGADPALRSRVDALLESDAALHGLLDHRSIGLDGGAGGRFPASTVIGRYTLVRLLGAGGMAAVYEAVQDSPRRTVAVKVMSRGVGASDALRRFQRESQILGRLRHHGIAQIFEAGMHDDGRGGAPYFAMEYIPGARPITDWADQARLGLPQRIDLIVRVCESVAHGHEQGVIHRDLKPSNVLVDATGIVKVIDFGIARAIGADASAPTLHTQTGNLIGTLQYMSPEQVSGETRDLDARCDVYSLGMVLYELICGRKPYDVSGLGVVEAATIIRERAPPRPSSVSREIHADLETIVLKSLEKDPRQRYAGVAALADDLSRFRANQPIAARPHSIAYRLRTTARRHKALVAATAATFGVLVIALAVVSTMAVRLKREASRREEVIGFLDSLLIAGDAYPFGPSRRHAPEFGANARWIDVIDEAVLTLDASPLSDAAAEASIRHRVGMIYFWMCRFDQAHVSLARAYALRREAGGEFDEATIDTRIGLVLCKVFLGDNIVAETEARRVVDDCRRALGANRRTLDALHAWYITLLYLDYNDAQDDIALEMRDIAGRHPELGYPQSVYEAFLGHARMLAGAFDESESLLRDAIAHSEVDSPGSLTHAWAYFMLGWLDAVRGSLASAESLMRRGCDMWVARSGPNMVEFEIAMDIAMIRQPHRRTEGLHLLRTSVDSVRQQVGRDHPFFASVAHRASEGFMFAERWSDAESLLREVMQFWGSPRHVWLQRDAITMSRLAEVLQRQGRIDEAEAALEQAIEIADRFTPAQWNRHFLGSADYFRRKRTALLDERSGGGALPE